MQMRRYLVTSTRWGSGAPIAYTVSYISLAHTFNVVSTLECAKKHCESERIKETTIDILENSTLTRHTFSAVLFTMQWIVPHVWCQNNDDVMHASSLIWTNTVRHQTRIHFTVLVVHSSIFGLKSIFFWFLSLSLYFSLSHIYYFDLLRILPTNRLQFWLRRKLWCCIVTADKIVKQMNAWPVLPLGGRGSMHTHRAILSTNMHKNQLFTVNHKKKSTQEKEQ